MLELGEEFLDGIEIGGVFRRQEEELGTSGPDVPDGRRDLCVSRDCPSPRHRRETGRHQHLLNIEEEALAVDWPPDQPWSLDPIMGATRPRRSWCSQWPKGLRREARWPTGAHPLSGGAMLVLVHVSSRKTSRAERPQDGTSAIAAGDERRPGRLCSLATNVFFCNSASRRGRTPHRAVINLEPPFAQFSTPAPDNVKGVLRQRSKSQRRCSPVIFLGLVSPDLIRSHAPLGPIALDPADRRAHAHIKTGRRLVPGQPALLNSFVNTFAKVVLIRSLHPY